METPEILLKAVRQYRHNSDLYPGFVFGFDHDKTVKIVESLQKELKEAKEERDNFKLYIHNIQSKSDCYDRICKRFNLKNNVIGFINGLQKELEIEKEKVNGSYNLLF